jgi:hypothetical protein
MVPDISISNDYILELDNFEDKFNADELIEACKLNKTFDEWKTDHEPERKVDYTPEFDPFASDYSENETYGVVSYNVPEDQPQVKHIFEAINQDLLSEKPIGWLCCMDGTRWTQPHIDGDRNTVLQFPIFPKPYTLAFLEDDLSTDKWKHDTSRPLFENCQLPHCVYDAGISRTFFQISLFFKDSTWSKIKANVENGNFFTKEI